VQISTRTPAAAAFQARYKASGVRPQGAPDNRGIYTIGDNHYIEQSGTLYSARYDTILETWRLKPNGGSGVSWGPAIRRTEGGIWEFHRPGLRAGTPDDFVRLRESMERAFPDPVERNLVNDTMWYERGVAQGVAPELLTRRPSGPITPAQRARWTETFDAWGGDAKLTREVYLEWNSRQRALAGEPRVTLERPYMKVPGPRAELPPNMRRIDPAEAPDTLYSYFESDPGLNLGPIKYTKRHHNPGGGPGKRTIGFAEMYGEWLAGDIRGLRVTSLPPTTSVSELQIAMGNGALATGRIRYIKIDARRLLDTDRTYHLGGTLHNDGKLADLVEVTTPLGIKARYLRGKENSWGTMEVFMDKRGNTRNWEVH
jgi:hypothetical protein